MSNGVSPYLTVKQCAERHPAFSEASLRHLLFFGEKNGFVRCIRRIGRRVLIHEPTFVDWVESRADS